MNDLFACRHIGKSDLGLDLQIVGTRPLEKRQSLHRRLLVERLYRPEGRPPVEAYRPEGIGIRKTLQNGAGEP